MSSWGNDDAVTRFDDCEALRATGKAVLVRVAELGEDIWVPKSVIHEDSEVYDRDHTGELVIKEWWACREGLV